MIARPLDLASRLRLPPRSLDAYFYISAGLVILNFFVLGSRFVLAPGLGVDFRLPPVAGAKPADLPATHHISVSAAGLIFADEGNITIDRLGTWLRDEARKTRDPALLVRADARVSSLTVVNIAHVAKEAGFRVEFAVDEATPRPGLAK